MKQSFTSGEAARLCGLGLTTLKRWVARGALKSYRTPGGAMRILRSDLLDFMREYDIPMHRLEPVSCGKLLVAVSGGRVRQELIAAAAPWADRIEISEVESDFDLGFALAKSRPDFVILEGQCEAIDIERAKNIRNCVSPHNVRIGLVCDYVKSGHNADAPEVVVDPASDVQWAEVLLARLFGGIIEETGNRRAG